MRCRGSTPTYGSPELQALRRVKPIPKRRRTGGLDTPSPDYTSTLSLPFSTDGTIDLANHPLMPPPDATAEELLAHAEALSAQMAFYMPGLGSVQDLIRNGLEISRKTATNYASFYANGKKDNNEGENKHRGSGQDDDDGDYMDHLLQPGNTKKRKVPTNLSGSARGQEVAVADLGEEESVERSSTVGRVELERVEAEPAQPSPPLLPKIRKPKLKVKPATRAGLKHKEMLKTRKRQLAAVLGALSLGDTFALDQALSAHYPFLSGNRFGDPTSKPRIRLSRRRGPRQARVVARTRQPRHPDAIPLPSSDFTFVFPSTTADRLISTKREVDILRERFETELARQAAKAVKLATSNHLLSTPSKGSRSKRSDRTPQRPRANGEKGNGDPTAEFTDQYLLGATKKRGKKKRSALANASNPHHLRNYVPSRLPSTRIDPDGQNQFGTYPFKFLSADIPSRRRKQTLPLPEVPTLSDEWICSFCEHSLFYGDDEELYRKAIRQRKKVLRRRRRARERVAATASNVARPFEGNLSNYDDYDAPFEPTSYGTADSRLKQGRSGNELVKDGDRGGESTSYG